MDTRGSHRLTAHSPQLEAVDASELSAAVGRMGLSPLAAAGMEQLLRETQLRDGALSYHELFDRLVHRTMSSQNQTNLKCSANWCT